MTEAGRAVGGAHIHGSVSGGQVIQVAGNYYQLVGGLPSVAAGRRWTIPPPVRSFTGRDQQLAVLRAQLTSQGAATLVPTAALYGMGGVGKTQLALAYAQHHRGDYQLGWWVPAETDLGMLTALAGLGVALGLPEELPLAELAAAARDGLGAQSGWLLIFDNAPDPAAVADFLPGAGGGHVLVTSRDSAWHGIAEPVSVDLLPLDAAVGLLQRRTGDPDEQAAARLAEALGRLPLALEQAAAYAAQQRLPLASYLELFDQRRAELLALGKPLAYHGTVDATFTLALDQLREANPRAALLAELCALLAPDEIPLALLLSEPGVLPEPLAAAAADPVQRSGVTGALYQQGLLVRDTADTARMHRLVQDVALAHLPDVTRRQRIAEAVEMVVELFPEEGWQPVWWPQCGRLLPHAQSLLNHAQAAQFTSLPLAKLLTNTSNYLMGRGLDVRLARQLHEQALAISQRLFPGDHPAVAQCLSNLAAVVAMLGEHGRARELSEQALAMRRRLFPGDHPAVAQSLSNLAVALTELEEHRRAGELFEQALAMFQRLHEGDHSDVAKGLTNLANHLSEQGEPEQALKLHLQALEMRQRLHNGDHPQVATCLDNLAGDFVALGELERARDLSEQALAMLQRLFEGDNPRVAQTMSNLANILYGLGELKRAQELEEQALAMDQRLAQS